MADIEKLDGFYLDVELASVLVILNFCTVLKVFEVQLNIVFPKSAGAYTSVFIDVGKIEGLKDCSGNPGAKCCHVVKKWQFQLIIC